MLILQEPRGGQERKQDSEDDPDINAHQSSPAAALPTNSSLTDRIYFDDLERIPLDLNRGFPPRFD